MPEQRRQLAAAQVEYQGRDRGLEFYTAKDDAVLQDSHFGLFGWDGKSRGTLRNVRGMAEQGSLRPCMSPPSKSL